MNVRREKERVENAMLIVEYFYCDYYAPRCAPRHAKYAAGKGTIDVHASTTQRSCKKFTGDGDVGPNSSAASEDYYIINSEWNIYGESTLENTDPLREGDGGTIDPV